ncbi:unnamed protein product [Owenia fusiformis]|uniref:Uncharacterized protein n=1 Tax=Owenia fusiformis TaxID=6347 RepID=A0A8J1XJ44_OWEFU|nr:unnamed protein product [Owenia fusiformis]
MNNQLKDSWNIFEHIHLMPSLIHLDLSANNMTSLGPIPRVLADTPAVLACVNISYNRITSIPENQFYLSTSLKSIDLSANRMKTINQPKFRNKPEYFVKYIDGDNENISASNITLPEPNPLVLEHSPYLQDRVNISYDRLTSIPESQFSQSEKWQVLDQSVNKIKTVNRQMLRIKPKDLVEYIVGKQNPFVCDCLMRWARNLMNESRCTVPILNEWTEKRMGDVPARLYLCQTKMKCPEKCECFADKVKEPYDWIHIKCSNKGLEYVPFGIPSTTNVLDVSLNIIEQLDSATFHNASFPVLQILDLTSCQIRALIGNDIFNGFDQLTILNLNNNYIVQLNGEPFKTLFWLNELHIANNSIKTIQDKVFSPLKLLSFLDLEGNQLQSVNLTIFEPLGLMLINGKPLSWISISVNGVGPINAREHWESKWSILLSNNPWDCCRGLPLKKWLNAHQSIIPNLVDIHCMRGNLTELVPLFEMSDSNLTCIPEPPIPFQQTSYFQAIIGVLVVVSFCLSGLLIFRRFKSHIKLKLFVLFGWRFDKIDDSNKQYDALLSYSGLNGEWMRDELLIQLEEAGYKLCLHERDFRAGEPIMDNINNAIDNSKRTIIVLSNEFLESGYAIYEFIRSHDDRARGERDPVILVLYDSLDNLDEDALAKHPTLNTYISTRTYLVRNNKYFWESIILAMPRRQRQRIPDNNDDDGLMLQHFN